VVVTVKWTRSKITLALVALFISAAMLIVLPAIYWQYHEARKTLSDFGDALAAQNYKEAYSLTSQDLQRVTSYRAFVLVHKGLEEKFGNLRKLSIDDSHAVDGSGGWYATMQVNMDFAHARLPFTFNLKKENGVWKIYSYYEQ
jgi:hypothetical protein